MPGIPTSIYVVLFLACCLTLSNGQWNITEAPRHTAARVGTEAEMFCDVNGNASPGEYFLWAWNNGFTDWQTIFNTQHPEHVEPGYNISGTFNLKILNVTKQTAGKYLAALRRPSDLNDERQALLLAMDRVYCIPRIFNVYVEEHETVNLTCGVDFYSGAYAGLLHPTLEWRNSLGEYLPTWNRTVIDGDKVTARNVTHFSASAKHHLIPFTCQLFFKGDALRPTYTDQCFTTVFVHSPNITFKPDPEDFPNRNIIVGANDTIECVAKNVGFDVSYRWEKILGEGPNYISGPIIRMSPYMNSQNMYRCFAWSGVFEPPYQTNATVLFSIGRPTRNVTITPVKEIYKLSDTISCRTNDMEQPVYIWRRIYGRGPGIFNESTLRFNEDHYASKNVYECIAHEYHAPCLEARRSITFDVEGFNVYVAQHPRNMVAVKNSTPQFTFRVDGWYSWKEDPMVSAFLTTRFPVPPRMISSDTNVLHRESSGKYGVAFGRAYDYRRLFLSIKNVDTTDIGLYHFHMGTELVNRMAFLIVLDSYPICNVSGTPVEDEQLELTCEVSFHGPYGKQWVPRMRWYSRFTPEQSNYYNETYMIHTARFNVSYEDHLRFFHCETTYNPPSPSTVPRFYYDQQAPSFKHICSLQIDLQYSVKLVKITPDPGPSNSTVNVKLHSYISCDAKGNPEPSFAWYRNKGNGPEYVIKKKLLVSKDMISGMNSYTCVAQNRIRETLYEAKKDINFYVV